MSRDHHADGQQDYINGEYNPPHTISPLDTFIYDDHTLEEMDEDNDEYNAGYNNARNQH